MSDDEISNWEVPYFLRDQFKEQNLSLLKNIVKILSSATEQFTRIRTIE